MLSHTWLLIGDDDQWLMMTMFFWPTAANHQENNNWGWLMANDHSYFRTSEKNGWFEAAHWIHGHEPNANWAHEDLNIAYCGAMFGMFTRQVFNTFQFISLGTATSTLGGLELSVSLHYKIMLAGKFDCALSWSFSTGGFGCIMLRL